MEHLISYDPETGAFYSKVHRGKLVPGERLGTTDARGYVVISVNYRKYKAHRLAWFLAYGVWPVSGIDHINGNTLDNRIVNLREATTSQNNMNSQRSRRNSTGFKGVNPFRGKYRAFICSDKKPRYLGTFKTAEEAHSAYCLASAELHGEFGRVE